jgi:hypothetical protein
MSIAGHTYNFGRCECGRWRSDVNSAAREAIARGATLVDEPSVAHVGRCTQSEWEEIKLDLEAQTRSIELAMWRLSVFSVRKGLLSDVATLPKSAAEMELRARELFERAKQANDPDTRDCLSAAAWYYADMAERANEH